MPEPHWTEMAKNRQQLQKLSRALLHPCPKSLSASEFELLSRLYIKPQENTPRMLSERSGMKKEAVSRCLKNLVEHGFVDRRRNPDDERSRTLSITERGISELEAGYTAMLQPFYDLRREQPDTFDELFSCIRKLDSEKGSDL